jgi:hypothetical protein
MTVARPKTTVKKIQQRATRNHQQKSACRKRRKKFVAMTTNTPQPEEAMGKQCTDEEDCDGTSCQGQAEGHRNPEQP